LDSWLQSRSLWYLQPSKSFWIQACTSQQKYGEMTSFLIILRKTYLCIVLRRINN
jgi:hypothetical protein